MTEARAGARIRRPLGPRRSFALVVVLLTLGLGACSTDPPVADGAPPPAAGERQISYVAIGGNETVNRGLGDGFRRSWTGQVFAALPRSTVFANLASSRAKVKDALTDQVPQALALEPTVVTVWFTGEDAREGTSAEAFSRDLTQVATQLKTSGARVVLLTRPDSGGGRYAATTARVAEATGTEVLSLPPAPADRGDPIAQKAIADVVGPVVTR